MKAFPPRSLCPSCGALTANLLEPPCKCGGLARRFVEQYRRRGSSRSAHLCFTSREYCIERAALTLNYNPGTPSLSAWQFSIPSIMRSLRDRFKSLCSAERKQLHVRR